jgi:hypothetical protein
LRAAVYLQSTQVVTGDVICEIGDLIQTTYSPEMTNAAIAG